MTTYWIAIRTRKITARTAGWTVREVSRVLFRSHLLAWQRVQCEARRHLRNAHGAVIDDDVLDCDQDQKDHRQNRRVDGTGGQPCALPISSARLATRPM